ncbi:MAG: DNA-binding response regulator [Armatimonadetes bacterium CG_4_10_14_3_um_filter_66_18]|nr:MAG: DNA-binding response regulator [Armatimonadetes bacterium CG_4_10_14_3_um_filter_66_18]
MKKKNALRVLVADDHPVVREGLAALINRRPDMAVVAEASTGQEAVEQFLLHRPDVALLDLRMPEMDGVEVIAAIREQVPTARLVVLTTYADEEDIHRSLRAGARGYLLKDAPRDELLDCVRAVHDGQTVIPPAIALKLASRLRATELTPRELDVLRLLATGQSNKQIAAALFIAEGTVKTHVNALLRKLEAADRTGVVTLALKRGLLRLE